MSVSSSHGNLKEHFPLCGVCIKTHRLLSCAMMFGSLALSAIIIIMSTLSLTLILKCVSPDSSEGLQQGDWTRCQVEYYNEQELNNSSRSINGGIFIFAPNPIAALPLSVSLV